MSLSMADLVEKLSRAGICSPRLEARLLMEKAPNDQMLQKMLNERLQHKPLDKILGQREFYKYCFKVNENVLSPRPDTETLVEAAVNLIKINDMVHVLDLGVGSGCILLSLLADFAWLIGVGIDKSRAALDVAQKNAVLLGVADRCHLIKADWFEDSFLQKQTSSYDLIVSNPPYIPTEEIKSLAPEVKNYDPHLALDGGKDGLESYRKIALIASLRLRPKGYLLLEAGINQAANIIAINTHLGLAHIQTLKDLAGIERCIIFQKKGCNL